MSFRATLNAALWAWRRFGKVRDAGRVRFRQGARFRQSTGHGAESTTGQRGRQWPRGAARAGGGVAPSSAPSPKRHVALTVTPGGAVRTGRVFARLLQARKRWNPSRASACAAALPRPFDAPVTTQTRPRCAPDEGAAAGASSGAAADIVRSTRQREVCAGPSGFKAMASVAAPALSSPRHTLQACMLREPCIGIPYELNTSATDIRSEAGHTVPPRSALPNATSFCSLQDLGRCLHRVHARYAPVKCSKLTASVVVGEESAVVASVALIWLSSGPIQPSSGLNPGPQPALTQALTQALIQALIRPSPRP